MLHSLGSHAKELKQQGAMEAAQDKNTEATAQDAEKVLVEESIKGGAVAFQFDPDATPQEKAAQAGAVSILRYLLPRPLLICRLIASPCRVSSQEEVRGWHCNRHCMCQSCHSINYRVLLTKRTGRWYTRQIRPSSTKQRRCPARYFYTGGQKFNASKWSPTRGRVRP